MYEDVSFRIYTTCGECGTDLTFRIEQMDDTITVYPAPCPDCIKYDREEGYNKGYSNGIEEGRAER